MAENETHEKGNDGLPVEIERLVSQWAGYIEKYREISKTTEVQHLQDEFRGKANGVEQAMFEVKCLLLDQTG